MNNITKRIDAAKHIVVIAHINPDADSLSSASAMYTHLLRLHKKVSFFCVSKNIHNKLSFLPWFEKIRNTFPSSADLAISLDCASISRIGIELECDLINIDHHETNTNFGDFNIVNSELISTTHVLFNYFKINNIQINKKMATALYAGLLDDSDGFLSDKVDASIFIMSSELINLGAEYKLCNKFIMKYQSLAGLRLKAIMLEKMDLCLEARVALFLVSQDDMKKSGARAEDCENPLEEALFLPRAEVSLLIKQNVDLRLKVSIRSSGVLNASKIAIKFGGGGHHGRAGFNLSSKYTLQSASEEILQLINKEI